MDVIKGIQYLPENYTAKTEFKQPWTEFYNSKESSPLKDIDYAGPGSYHKSVLGGSDYIEKVVSKESPPIDEKAMTKAVECFNRKWGFGDEAKESLQYFEEAKVRTECARECCEMSAESLDLLIPTNKTGIELNLKFDKIKFNFKIGDKVKVIRESTDDENICYGFNVYTAHINEEFTIKYIDTDGSFKVNSKVDITFWLIPECCELIESSSLIEKFTLTKFKIGDKVVITNFGTDDVWYAEGLNNWIHNHNIGNEAIITNSVGSCLTISMDGYDRNIIPTSCVSRLPE